MSAIASRFHTGPSYFIGEKGPTGISAFTQSAIHLGKF